MSERVQRRKGGGREARRAVRLEAKVPAVPYITRNVPCYEVLGEEGLAVIEAQAETILQDLEHTTASNLFIFLCKFF